MIGPAFRFALRAIAVALLILTSRDCLNARMITPAAPGEDYPNLPGTPVARHFAWEDVNSLRVVGMKGEQEIVDARFPATRFSLEVLIDPVRLRKAIESYGIPASWMRYSYRTQEEKLQKEREQAVRCASRGVAVNRAANSLEPDYLWIIENSRKDVRETIVRLRDAGRQAGYTDFPRFIELVASFVQSLEYRIPPNIRKSREGDSIQTFGLTVPLETLYNGHGDCDSKAALFASLMANLADARVIFVRGANHIFAGIRTQPRPSERYVRLRGDNFVLIELTHPWRVGHIPNENWRAVQLKQMEIIPLFK